MRIEKGSKDGPVRVRGGVSIEMASIPEEEEVHRGGMAFVEHMRNWNATQETGLLPLHRKPVNRDAVKILRRIPDPPIGQWTKEDEEAIRWAGLISKCPKCGDRAYEHGYCFGCGKPLKGGDGDRKRL